VNERATGHAAAAPGAAPRNASTAGRFERAWLFLVEAVCVALVIADTIVLFAGVVARYVFNSPIIWSDELAATLFLWLGMLGAVMALREGKHMRLTAFVQLFGPATRRVVDAVSGVVIVSFLAAIVAPPWPPP
jgi:TRAP-type C4-dicarboxylate transport system permease small subunit